MREFFSTRRVTPRLKLIARNLLIKRRKIFIRALFAINSIAVNCQPLLILHLYQNGSTVRKVIQFIRRLSCQHKTQLVPLSRLILLPAKLPKYTSINHLRNFHDQFLSGLRRSSVPVARQKRKKKKEKKWLAKKKEQRLKCHREAFLKACLFPSFQLFRLQLGVSL